MALADGTLGVVNTTRVADPGIDPLNEPINKSSDYQAMEPYWVMIDTILGGAQAMRDAGELYLPRFQNEQVTNDGRGHKYDPYQERLRATPFTNIYEDISRNLASKPFARECDLDIDWKTKQPYAALSEDIDTQGNNLHVFAQMVFQSAIDYAIAWILVEFTKATPRPDGQPLSKTEEQQQGLRPYWVHIPARRMLAVYSDFVAGREEIVHARISDPVTKIIGYTEQLVERVRVFQRDVIEVDVAGKPTNYGPAYFQLFEQVINEKNQTGWKLVDEGPISIGIIPLVPFVTGRRNPASWRVDPPLRGIGYMQIYEYHQESNLKTIMDMTCFPMLSGDGVAPPGENEKQVTVAPRAVLFGGLSADGHPGSWKFIEPSATSIAQVQAKLEKTQNDMRDLGMQPLTMQNLTVITTGQVAVKANSTVQAWTIKFKDSLELAWAYTAMWLGKPDEPEVYIFQDFNVALDTGQGWKAVWDMRQSKEVSHETTIESAKRYGYLPDNFDVEKNDEQLATEAENQPTAGEQLIDPATGKPIDTSGMQVPGGGQQKQPLTVMQGQRTVQ